MIRYKIRDITFECDEAHGTATVTMPESEDHFTNALEAWTFFTSRALWPLERHLRDSLEEHGFNRHTGIRNFYTESEIRAMDEAAFAREVELDL